MTPTELLEVLNNAFAEAGISTPEQVSAFIKIAALQVKKNSQLFELQKLIQAQQGEVIAQEKARADKQAELNATDAEIIGMLSKS